MTYTGPGSAQLERLGRVPQDGAWRKTSEMNEYMGYRDARDTLQTLKKLEEGIDVRSRLCECGNSIYWRRSSS